MCSSTSRVTPAGGTTNSRSVSFQQPCPSMTARARVTPVLLIRVTVKRKRLLVAWALFVVTVSALRIFWGAIAVDIGDSCGSGVCRRSSRGRRQRVRFGKAGARPRRAADERGYADESSDESRAADLADRDGPSGEHRVGGASKTGRHE